MNNLYNIISTKAVILANHLIKTYQIQPGYGLSSYLGSYPYLDNHMAVALWVEGVINTWPTEKRTLGQLRKAFIENLPNYLFG